MAVHVAPTLLYLREVEAVRWFRGMSKVQTDACEALSNALRDDLQQSTAHRVLRCCKRLGLDRLVPTKQVKIIMDLSQGNDLAFLWFLWEAHYKRPDKDRSCDSIADEHQYTVNEQLLLSAIAHLDLPSTYCELEKLLPPASSSVKRQAEQRALRLAKEQKLAEQQHAQRHNSRSYPIPYFAPQPLPKLYRPATKQTPRELKMIFPSCKEKHGVRTPNQPHRWFASYQLSPSKRLVKKLLTDEIDRMLLDEQATQKAQARVLCAHHNYMEELANEKKQKLAVETLRRCLLTLNVQEPEQQARRHCIAQLEREIELASARLQQYKQSQLINIHKQSGGVQCCKVCSKLMLLDAKTPSRKADLSLLVGMDLKHVAVSRSGCGDCCRKTVDPSLMPQEKPQLAAQQDKKRKRGGTESQVQAKGDARYSELQPKPQPKPQPRQQSVYNDLQYMQDLKQLKPHCNPMPAFWPYPLPNTASPLTSRSLIQQMKIDYFKIFSLPEGLQKQMQTNTALEDAHSTASKQQFIEQCCIKALNQPVEETTTTAAWPDEEQPSELLHNSHALMLSAADRCALNIFKWRLSEHEKIPVESPPDSPELAKIESVDPDDKAQIEKLLYLALQVMRRNPRNVLASFPNAHKLPVLLDWVADRYGKTYTEQEMKVIARAPEYIYETIARAELPRFKQKFKYKVFESYSRRDEIKCMSEQMRSKYFKLQDDQTMDVARLVWLAMRGYANMGRPITDTYFAYMPSHMLSLYHVLWKNHNFRNMCLVRTKLGSLI